MRQLEPDNLPRHVAIIPDGNGRWAESRGLARNAGHERGTRVVREVVRAAHELGIRELTIFAFSTENWGRPRGEVRAIMRLLDHYVKEEAEELTRNGIRVRAIGRLHTLEPQIQRAVARLVERTEGNREMQLTFALSYSGRAELVDAVRSLARAVDAGQLDPDAIDEKEIQRHLYAGDLPDPDLLIRTGGEHRVSNFLLWQFAYTELWMTEALWPDFTKSHLVEALVAYQRRERRFGKTGEQVRQKS